MIEKLDEAGVASLLALNTNNYRSVKRTHVDYLARQMAAGLWRGVTTITLHRKADGKLVLIDGQHRLLAALQAGFILEARVVIEEDASVVDILDTGLARTVGDVLKAHGEIHSNQLAAGLRWGIGEARGTLPVIHRVSGQEVLSFLDAHPGYRASTAAISGKLTAAPLRGRSGAGIWLHYSTFALTPEWAEVFWGRLISGEDLSPGDPILALRNRILRNANDQHKVEEAYFAAWIINGWNAYVDGRSISKVAWHRSGPNAQEFPALRAPRD